MMFEGDRCSTKYCRGKPVLTYRGKPLCQKCWNRICDDEDQMWTNAFNMHLNVKANRESR